MSIRPSDPAVIIAGIRQFGLAADGSDLRDLEAVIQRLQEQVEQAGWKTQEAVAKARAEMQASMSEAQKRQDRVDRQVQTENDQSQNWSG